MGSNQYRQRTGSELAPVGGDLVGQVGAPARRRCGDVWGTDCQAWVQAPSWSHGRHGLGGDRLAAADNITCSPMALEMLAGDEYRQVRASVGGNPSTPPVALAQLAGDEDWLVRWEVGANPSTPPQVLTQLALDEYRQVRASVGANPSTPPEALAQLLADADIGVRQSVLDNPRLPEEYRLLHRVAQ